MRKLNSRLALMALMLTLAPELVFCEPTPDGSEHASALEGRSVDTYKVFNRIRNAHACIMSIVFIVLLPLGAISVHLPIDLVPGLRNTYLRRKIPAMHMPIQLLGFVMMVGGMGLGIRLGQDTGYLYQHPTQAHLVIGLLVTSTLIAFQPLMGALQHRHYKRTGGKSAFAYAHRWLGRVAILLGIINNGLGFWLASGNVLIPRSSYYRNFILAGVLVLIWWGLVLFDAVRQRRTRAGLVDGEKGGVGGDGATPEALKASR